MALQDLLELTGSHNKKIGLSEERLEPLKPYLRQYIAYWREYPDMFIDFLQDGGNPEIKKELNFYSYQRVYLRVAMRYKYVYAVFPRAYGKSFLSILTLMIKCILFPRSKLFVTSGGKEQSASIVREKVNELCTLVPALNRELDRRPGKTREGKDYVKYVFRNGSYFDNVAASERSRGQRRHAGLIEECVGVDGDILSQVILPMMNVDRRAMDGEAHPDEVLNKSQLYITTAGYKGTFSYDKLIQILVWMATEPDKAFVMGGTYRTPVLAGLQSPDFIKDMQRDGTFNDAAFAREYESKWSGTSENAFFDGEAFDRNRSLMKAENESSGKIGNGGYYIISADIGRKGDASVFCVFKVLPQPVGSAFKNLVNIYTLDNEHFEEQAIMLKKLYFKYKARRIVIDGNGLGIGLLDYMVKSQIDPATGDIYQDFGILNDENGDYKKYRTSMTEQDAIYVIKANAPINTEAHSNAQVQLTSGHVKFLIEEREAKSKLLGTKVGQAMTPEQRAEYLKPYTLTSILKEEMMNLREENEGVNIILKKANKSIKKDKFSAFEYGLYYIKEEEEKKKKKKFNAKEWMLLN